MFPLESVGKIYNKNFICYKVDIEVGEGKELKKRFGVKHIPTLKFLNTDGSEIMQGNSQTFSDEKGFIRMANLALGKENRTFEWYEEKYKNGKRDSQFLKDYIKVYIDHKKNRAPMELRLALLNSYPKSEWWTAENQRYIINNASKGNPFYNIWINNKDKFSIISREGYIKKFMMKILVSDGNDKIISTINKDWPEYADAAIEYYNIQKFKERRGKYLKKLNSLKAKHKLNEGFAVNEVIDILITSKHAHKEYLPLAIKYAGKQANRDSWRFYAQGVYAFLLYKNGNKAEAMKFVNSRKKLYESHKTSKLKWSLAVFESIMNGKMPKADKS